MVRFKNRWLLLHITDSAALPSFTSSSSGNGAPATPISPSSLVRALRASLQLNFGDAGAGALAGGVACRYVQPRTGVAIVRCGRDAAPSVMLAAALLHECEGRRVRICVRWCGGTIKKVQLKAIALSRTRLVALQRERRRLARLQSAEQVAQAAQTAAASDAPTATAPGETAAAAPQTRPEKEEKLDAAAQSEMKEIIKEIKEVRT